MFTEKTFSEIDKVAKNMGVETAALLAVVEVESGGKVTATVNGRQEPLIRFEGHYFDKRLTGAKRQHARDEGLASPTAGAVANPSSQQKRYDMLARARRIDDKAALESCSWGVGQVMGAHWQWLGYVSVNEMVETARRSLIGQVELMALYIEKANLSGALKRRDWAAFARGYNGPNFKRYKYDTNLAKAYARYAGDRAAARPSPSTGMLKMGSTGARVRELQTLLSRAGFPCNCDGEFGTGTDKALRAFQQSEGLDADGVAGPDTMRRLQRFLLDPKEEAGLQPVMEVQEVKDAAKVGTPLALITAAHDQLANGAATLLGLESDTAQTLASWLMAGAAVLGVALAAWAVYGILKRRKTDEGDV